jgi:hypothetical protein
MTAIARHLRPGLAALLAILAIVCAVAAGCGGDDAPAAADSPEPRTYKAFAEHVAQLLAEADDGDDCQRLRKIDQRSLAELPCPAPEDLRERMGDFEVVDSGLYSSDRAGVVDYRPSEAGGTTSMVLLIGPDGKWTVMNLDISPKRPNANVADDGDSNLRRAMLRYEAAARKRDCEELIRLAYRPAGTPRPSCQERLAATSGLAKVLKGDPGQRPSYNGGNEDFSFYSMTAYHPTATHHTFTMIQTEIDGKKRFLTGDLVRDE